MKAIGVEPGAHTADRLGETLMRYRIPLLVLAFVLSLLTARADGAWIKGPSKERLEFKRTAQGKIYIPAELKGRSLFFLVDTGGMTMIDLSVARELGFAPTSAGDVATTWAGSDGERFVLHVDLNLGKFAVGNLQISSLDLGYLKGLEKPEIAGVIGADLLILFRARIDYGDSTLTLNRPK